MSKFDNGAWKSAINAPDQKPITSFITKGVEPLASKWKAMTGDKITKIGARINRSNLLGRASKNRPTVRFLRSGKMWAVVVG